MPPYARSKKIRYDFTDPIAGKLKGLWVFIKTNDLNGLFSSGITKAHYKDFDDNYYYQRRNRGGAFSPPVIVLLKEGDNFFHLWSMTPNRMKFLVSESKYIVAQAIIVTEPNSEAEIAPTRELQSKILSKGILNRKTKETTNVMKTIIVGLGG